MSLRTEKVASLIQEIIAQPVSDLAKTHNAGLATVTTVRITDDLQKANIYVSCFAGKTKPIEFIHILEKNEYLIKDSIAKEAHLRFVPETRFFLDDTLDQMERIQSLIDKAKEEGGDS